MHLALGGRAPAPHILGMDTPELITVSVAARLLATSETTVRRLCDAGKLRCWRASGVRVLRRLDVEELASARRGPVAHESAAR